MFKKTRMSNAVNTTSQKETKLIGVNHHEMNYTDKRNRGNSRHEEKHGLEPLDDIRYQNPLTTQPSKPHIMPFTKNVGKGDPGSKRTDSTSDYKTTRNRFFNMKRLFQNNTTRTSAHKSVERDLKRDNSIISNERTKDDLDGE